MSGLEVVWHLCLVGGSNWNGSVRVSDPVSGQMTSVYISVAMYVLYNFFFFGYAGRVDPVPCHPDLPLDGSVPDGKQPSEDASRWEWRFRVSDEHRHLRKPGEHLHWGHQRDGGQHHLLRRPAGRLPGRPGPASDEHLRPQAACSGSCACKAQEEACARRGCGGAIGGQCSRGRIGCGEIERQLLDADPRGNFDRETLLVIRGKTN